MSDQGLQCLLTECGLKGLKKVSLKKVYTLLHFIFDNYYQLTCWLESSVDPNRLASDEAICSGSTLLSVFNRVYKSGSCFIIIMLFYLFDFCLI